MAIQSFAEPGYQLASIFVGVVVLFCVIRWNDQRRRARKLGSKAPAVAYYAPFGIDLFATAIRCLLTHDFFAWTRRILDVPGRTVSLTMLGTTVLLTDEPENTKAVLSTKSVDFGKGEVFHKIWHDLMFDSIFSTDGALWHSNKDILRDQTAKSRPTDYPITERHVMDRFLLDVVSDIFFGESAGTLSTQSQPVRDAVDGMYTWNSKRTLAGKLGVLLPGSSKASAVMVKYLDSVIDQAESMRDQQQDDEKERRRQSLLGSLIAQNVSRKRIKDSMLAILIGGKDPGSITLVWAFYELARNPTIVEKLRKEIGSTVGFSTLPTAIQLKGMVLLQNIIKETLRLHLPLGFNLRTAFNDTVLPTGGGPSGKDPVAVLKGTHVMMSVIGTQRRHDLIGPTADDFDPSRWETWKPKHWEFLPFNHGPRICLGRNFAWMQMEYVICRLFQEFSTVERVWADHGQGVPVAGAGEEMKIKLAMNTKPAEPVYLRFEK